MAAANASSTTNTDRPPVSAILSEEIPVEVASKQRQVAHLPGTCETDATDKETHPAGEVDLPLCIHCAKVSGLDPQTGDRRPRREDVDIYVSARGNGGDVHRLHPDATEDDPLPVCAEKNSQRRSIDWRTRTARQAIFLGTCSECFYADDRE